MKRFLAMALLVGASAFGLAGCGEQSKVESEQTIKTPEGETTVTDTKKVEQSGENPPPGPQGETAK